MKIRARLLIAGALVAAGLGAALLPAACTSIPITEAQVFQPKRSVTPEAFEHPSVRLDVHRIETSDRTRLDAWYLSQPDARATVLFFGGQGFYLVQSIEYIEALTQLGLNVFMWDYRGYGQSEGEPTVRNLKADALEVYAYLVQTLGVSPSSLVLHGHSVGSFLAAHTAARREAAALVLENPVSSVEAWTEQLIPAGLDLFLRLEADEVLAAESNLDNVSRFERSLLVFAGTEDFVTPPKMAHALVEAAQRASSKELVLIEGGSHNGLYDFAPYAEAYASLLATVTARGAETTPAVMRAR